MVAVDYDRESLESLKESSLEYRNAIDVVESDIADYRSDIVYNIILLNFVLHFLTSEEVQEVLNRVYGMLRKGGMLVVSDFYGEGALKYSRDCFWFQENDISSVFQEYGYQIISETR